MFCSFIKISYICIQQIKTISIMFKPGDIAYFNSSIDKSKKEFVRVTEVSGSTVHYKSIKSRGSSVFGKDVSFNGVCKEEVLAPASL